MQQQHQDHFAHKMLCNFIERKDKWPIRGDEACLREKKCFQLGGYHKGLMGLCKTQLYSFGCLFKSIADALYRCQLTLTTRQHNMSKITQNVQKMSK